MTYILGLNAYHADAAACLVKDGALVAAVAVSVPAGQVRRVLEHGDALRRAARLIAYADVG
jgi:Predicted carbamoyl transferase, NodU family